MRCLHTFLSRAKPLCGGCLNTFLSDPGVARPAIVNSSCGRPGLENQDTFLCGPGAARPAIGNSNSGRPEHKENLFFPCATAHSGLGSEASHRCRAKPLCVAFTPSCCEQSPCAVVALTPSCVIPLFCLRRQKNHICPHWGQVRHIRSGFLVGE